MGSWRRQRWWLSTLVTMELKGLLDGTNKMRSVLCERPIDSKAKCSVAMGVE